MGLNSEGAVLAAALVRAHCSSSESASAALPAPGAGLAPAEAVDRVDCRLDAAPALDRMLSLAPAVCCMRLCGCTRCRTSLSSSSLSAPAVPSGALELSRDRVLVCGAAKPAGSAFPVHAQAQTAVEDMSQLWPHHHAGPHLSCQADWPLRPWQRCCVVAGFLCGCPHASPRCQRGTSVYGHCYAGGFRRFGACTWPCKECNVILITRHCGLLKAASLPKEQPPWD